MASRIGVIGGTGPEGKGLAARFAKAGLDVFIGSRDRRWVPAPLVEDRPQRGHDRRRIFCREHTGCSKRLSPRDAAGDVVIEQRAIEAKRDAEVECGGVGAAVEPS